MQYSRNEIDFKRGTFRAKGDIAEIYPSSQSESAVRVEFWGDEIEKISEINPLTGKAIGERKTHSYSTSFSIRNKKRQIRKSYWNNRNRIRRKNKIF